MLSNMTPEDRSAFVKEIADAVGSSSRVLSDDELRWVRMAIQKEAQSIELRKAIITKSLSSLAWMAIVALGYLIVDFLKAHGLKV